MRLKSLLGALCCYEVRGLYVHVPFCFHKCHYCDFYSIVGDEAREEAFVARLLGEMESVGGMGKFGSGYRTVFAGGGTPTLLGAEAWERILKGMRRSFDMRGVEEWTVEANPETVDERLMEVLAGGGVNRISMGAQSFDRRHLKTLERWHEPENVARAVGMAREAGIGNVNVDLIFGIPGQTLGEWEEDLEKVLALGAEHLSCYSLMYEPGTAMTKKLEMGRLERCDAELEVAMYEMAIERLGEAGYEHYEVSNFAQPGRRCAHNMGYWLNENWVAIGPGGSGHVAGVRWKNVAHLGKYLSKEAWEEGTEIEDVEKLDEERSIGEQLMLRLRLIEGVDRDWLEAKVDGKRREIVKRLAGEGLVVEDEMGVRLTRRGLMVADMVTGELL